MFDIAADYERIINSYNVNMYQDYEDIKRNIFSIKKYIDQLSTGENVPCHNDPLCENWVIDCDGRMYLIDWEYAGMNDPMWDLADVSIEASLGERNDDILLASYFNKEPTVFEYARFQANKLFLDYLWTLWGKTRVPCDGLPMEQYADMRYIRLKKNLLKFKKMFPNYVHE